MSLAAVQPIDSLEKSHERGRVRKPDEIRPQARVARGLELAANVDFRRRILADQDYPEPRRPTCARPERLDARHHLRPNLIRDGDAVEHSCRHFARNYTVRRSRYSRTRAAGSPPIKPPMTA